MSVAADRKRVKAAEAALEVLALSGARGLTHRAVDQEAGFPPGSTSNYFPTRSALLAAALRRHVELDLPPTELIDQLSDAKLSREQAGDLLLASLDRLLAPKARSLLIARYELVLESTRHAELQHQFEFARERFIDLAAMLLRATGCKAPRAHAVQMLVLMDGISLDNLLAAESALDHDGIAEAIARQLASC
jgi:DNA-binding transcriptional regulator YbjK